MPRKLPLSRPRRGTHASPSNGFEGRTTFLVSRDVRCSSSSPEAPPSASRSAVKVPLLLLGTAFLSFPTYFVLQMLRGSKPLTLDAAVAVQLSSLSATAVLWGSFAPPLLFLVGSTHHYRLAQFFSLAIGAVGGLVGIGRFLRLHRELVEPDRILRGHLLLYFALFSVVGGQLAWVLRPFIGDPGLPFRLVRTLGGDMFTHILRLLFG
jgi:hypothetical protein